MTVPISHYFHTIPSILKLVKTDTNPIQRYDANFHTIPSILKLYCDWNLRVPASLNFHTIPSILKRPGQFNDRRDPNIFPYDSVYFKAPLLLFFFSNPGQHFHTIPSILKPEKSVHEPAVVKRQHFHTIPSILKPKHQKKQSPASNNPHFHTIPSILKPRPAHPCWSPPLVISIRFRLF